MLLMLIWWEKKTTWSGKRQIWPGMMKPVLEGRNQLTNILRSSDFFLGCCPGFKGICQENDNPKWSVQIFFFPYSCISKELSLICLILFWYRLGRCTVLSEQEGFSLEENVLLPREISATTTTKQNHCCFSTPVTLSSNHKTSSH